MRFQSADISMVDCRSHVPARLHVPQGTDPLEDCGVDWPSHINVLRMSGGSIATFNLQLSQSARYAC